MQQLLRNLDGSWLRGEIDLHYQPQFDRRSGRLVGFEALARWTAPTTGPIAPSRFIPVAEASGLIAPLGAWILENACRRAAAWQKQNREVGVAVNVSALQFTQHNFVSIVSDAIEGSGIAAESLQLEITESALLPDEPRTGQVMRELLAMGLSLSIDDFGRGHSSFDYVRRLPFTTVKLDRRYVRRVNRSTLKWLEQIVDLAHSLGMEVVAEGIENIQQLRVASDLACDTVQGFLLGRPDSDPETILRTGSAFSGFQGNENGHAALLPDDFEGLMLTARRD